MPQFELVDPGDIFVEDKYQRVIGANGTRLIRRIYAEFDWTKFKAPVCVRISEWDNVLVCIDGQHTATAAASHPGISKIPVMILSRTDAQARARAFVGHNRDRLGLTQMAIFYAELAADDPIAVKVDQACKAAGAEILRKSVNLKQKLPPGKTIAVGTIRAIAGNKGVNFLTRVLKVLVQAGRGPIKADEIGAVALVLESSPPGDVASATVDRLAEVVKTRSAEAWAASIAPELAEKGGSVPFVLAREWADQMGYGLAPGLARPGRQAVRSRLGDTARMMARRPKVVKEIEPPRANPVSPAISAPATQKNAPVVSAARPVAPPVPPKPRPAPPPAPDIRIEGSTPVSGSVVTFNGIAIDLKTRELTHRGQTVRIHRDDGVRLVAGLARVMPALLDDSRLARTAFGVLRPDSKAMLKALVDDIAPALTRAKLEVHSVNRGSLICLRPLSE